MEQLEYSEVRSIWNYTPQATGRTFYQTVSYPPSPGLPDGVTRWDVLKALKGARKALALSPALLGYLEFLIARTFDQDWLAGEIPVVFAAVKTAAQILDVSEKQINNYERSLAARGLLTWRDSGNRRRYGKRNADGSLKIGFGVDLTPLIERYPAIVRMSEADRLELELRNERLAAIRSCRRVLREGLAMAALQGQDNDVIRSAADLLKSMPRTFAKSVEASRLCSIALELDDMCARLRAVLSTQEFSAEIDETSDRAEQNFRPNTKTHTKQNPVGICNAAGPSDQPLIKGEVPLSQKEPADAGGIEEEEEGKSPRRTDPPCSAASTGIEHVTIDKVLGAASDMMRQMVQEEAGQGTVTWAALSRATDRAAGYLGVSPKLWAEIREKISPAAAAVCVVIAERRMTDPKRPVRNPAGFVRAMLGRAELGTLHLHRSVFGLSRHVETHPETAVPSAQVNASPARRPVPAFCSEETVPVTGKPASLASVLPNFSATRETNQHLSS